MSSTPPSSSDASSDPPSSPASSVNAATTSDDDKLVVAIVRWDTEEDLALSDPDRALVHVMWKLQASWHLFDGSHNYEHKNPSGPRIRIYLTGRVGDVNAGLVFKDGRLQSEVWEDDVPFFKEASRLVIVGDGGWTTNIKVLAHLLENITADVVWIRGHNIHEEPEESDLDESEELGDDDDDDDDDDDAWEEGVEGVVYSLHANKDLDAGGAPTSAASPDVIYESDDSTDDAAVVGETGVIGKTELLKGYYAAGEEEEDIDESDFSDDEQDEPRHWADPEERDEAGYKVFRAKELLAIVKGEHRSSQAALPYLEAGDVDRFLDLVGSTATGGAKVTLSIPRQLIAPRQSDRMLQGLFVSEVVADNDGDGGEVE